VKFPIGGKVRYSVQSRMCSSGVHGGNRWNYGTDSYSLDGRRLRILRWSISCFLVFTQSP